MSTLLVCLLPLLYSGGLLVIGWYVGRHGMPVRWIGFRRRVSDE
jgi:hypothetical protein